MKHAHRARLRTRIHAGIRQYQCNVCDEWFTVDRMVKNPRLPCRVRGACKMCHNGIKAITRARKRDQVTSSSL